MCPRSETATDGPASFTEPVPHPKLYFRPGGSNVGSVSKRQPSTCDQRRRPADVRDAEVGHAPLGTPRSAAHDTACSAAQVRA